MRLINLFLAAVLSVALASGATLTGNVTISGTKVVHDAIVYIDRMPDKKFTAPAQPLILDQINMTFTPRVLPVLSGTTVSFPNGDEITHNVFFLGPNGKSSLGSYGKGGKRSYEFTVPGEYTVLCNVHAEMSAHVFVTETPYFAVTDRNGNFVIKNVPAGHYVLKIWHERYKGRSISIDIKESDTLSVKFQVQR